MYGAMNAVIERIFKVLEKHIRKEEIEKQLHYDSVIDELEEVERK